MENSKYIMQLKNIVLDKMKNENVKIYLFGSWGRGTQRRNSDVDIAIEYQHLQINNKIGELREMIEESCIPYRVDVIDMSQINDKMARNIRKDGVLWKG